jgi:hypothetical protein
VPFREKSIRDVAVHGKMMPGKMFQECELPFSRKEQAVKHEKSPKGIGGRHPPGAPWE